MAAKRDDGRRHMPVWFWEVTAAGADTIDGAGTFALAAQYDSLTIIDVAVGIWSIV